VPAWKSPLRGDVPPSENQQRCVMFVCAERMGQRVPVGTAFLIGVPGEYPGQWFKYFVTANHVVRDGTRRWIRFRRHDGGTPVDEEISGWIDHPTCDVAMAGCELDTDQYIANYQEEEYFSDKFPPGAIINLGERAYFVGLLADVETMEKRAIPMMRAAVVGALYVENVPFRIRHPDGNIDGRQERSAHLIDTNSRAGFSGSPVYVDHPYVNMQGVKLPDVGEALAVQLTSFSALLGVLIGHFTSDESGASSDNAGVGVVAPIDALRELLEEPDLVKWRERKAKEMKAEREQRFELGSAVADAVPQEPESEYERFEGLTQRLVQVPKKELDEKRHEEED
jgi:NADH:ubiquinone oxidoreductase subunit